MILIFSVLNDYTTYEVMKWLNHFGEKNVIRINSDETHRILFSIQNNKIVLNIDGIEIDFNSLKAVWYRKGGNWFGGQFDEIIVQKHSELSAYLNRNRLYENKVLNEYIHYVIKQNTRVLGSAFKSNLNKLMTLIQAKSAGLLIPNFHIENDFESIKKIANDSTPCITKSMSDGVYLFDSEKSQTGYFTYTEELTNERLMGLPKKIAPSFIQNKINKNYEIRAFYLDGEFFSWAILSQNDEKTKTDFRKYNGAKPNRNLPVEIPKKVQEKLKNLFNSIGLNTGSIDLMVDHNNNYYFLEINPVGQFGFLSKLSNYQLEKHVAKWLINT